MRGKHLSRPMEELVTEAKSLAANGTKELLLIAQDSTYYGLDLYKDRRLGELMRKLAEVDGIEWIRLHYAFPSGFPEDVLDVMRSEPKICKYIDIPLQHISDNMLKSMKRGTTEAKTYELVNRFREKVPGIALRTTLIAGYPGETEADHEAMLRFVEKARFDRLGIFTYSHEENTSAYALNDDVPEEVKQQRAEAVMALQQEVSEDINSRKVGNTYKVLFDRKEGDYFVGRTEFDSPEVDNEVLVSAKDTYIRIGDFAPVKITSTAAFDLYGEVVG
jgi:ribosomal protein S12 methylthiotransferase